jgi:hypothetical protein
MVRPAFGNDSHPAPHRDLGCSWGRCEASPLSVAPLCRHHLLVAYRVTRDLLDQVSAGLDDRTEPRQDQADVIDLVYYVRLPHGDIKIGHTSNLKQRMAGLRLTLADVMAVEFGGQPKELLRHQQFATLRRGRTEDFQPDELLIEHILELRSTVGDPLAAWDGQMRHNRSCLIGANPNATLSQDRASVG